MQNIYSSYRWDVSERSGLSRIEDSVENHARTAEFV